MNKILAMVMAFAMGMSVSASQIQWGNGTEIYKASGAADLVLDTDTSYFIRLYEAGINNSIDFSIAGNSISLGDDTYTGIQFNWSTGGADGYCYMDLFNTDTIYGINAGDKFYSVIFDSSLTDGNCAIIDSAVATATYPAGIMSYDAGGVNGGLIGAGGDWQAIPEPATFLLFGMGGFGAWLIRRNKSKAKEA